MGLKPVEIKVGPTTLGTRQMRTFRFSEVIYQGPMFGIGFTREPTSDDVDRILDASIGIRHFITALGSERIIFQNIYFLTIHDRAIHVIAEVDAWNTLEEFFLVLFEQLLPFEEDITRFG